jgi:hypothetical protein
MTTERLISKLSRVADSGYVPEYADYTLMNVASERLREQEALIAELKQALEFVAVAVIPDPNALVLNYAWLADRLAEARPKGGYGLSAFDLILKAAKAHAGLVSSK